jgi:hypothetical protein
MSSGEGEGAGARLFHFLADRDRGFSFRDPNYIFTNFAKQRGSGLDKEDNIFSMFFELGGRSSGARRSSGMPGSMR